MAYKKSNCYRHVLLGFISFFLVVFGLPHTGDHQFTAIAQGPPAIYRGWNPPGSTVKYSLSGFSSGDEILMVSDAFEHWTFHNRTNCSKIKFEAGSPNNFTLGTSTGSFPDNSTSVATTDVYHVGPQIVRCVTTFWWGAYGYDPVTLARVNGWDRNAGAPYLTALFKSAAHEIGHSMGLGHPTPATAGASIMNNFAGTNDSMGNQAGHIRPDDDTAVAMQSHYLANCFRWIPPIIVGGCVSPEPEGGCPPGTTPSFHDGSQPNGETVCCYPTPLIIDLDGDAFNLTNEASGVSFDIGGDGPPELVSWTDATADDAWLALDRNRNNVVDNSQELFGSFTQQELVAGDEANGFKALAEFDKLKFGGNNNGSIGPGDEVFDYLRLWVDTNHNGISEAGELFTLQSKNVVAISLNYSSWRHYDPHGNYFKYAAVAVITQSGTPVERIIADVYLLTNGGPPGGYFGLMKGGAPINYDPNKEQRGVLATSRCDMRFCSSPR